MHAWMNRAAVGLVASGLLAGCHRSSSRAPQSVSPDQFYTRGQGVATTRFSGVDKPAFQDDVKTDTRATVAPPPVTRPSVPSTVQAVVTTKPTTTTFGASEGTYMTLGGVVAEVNGMPIYANKILKLLETILSTKARELEGKQFETFAKGQIDKQLRELISNELEFAAAERNLDQGDRGIAEMLTIKWRGEQITLAGGSLEMARKNAADDGADFEDMVNQRYRFHMTQVYSQKKVIPQIQASADDMRRYYNANLNAEFTQQEQAEFRLIKIDPKLRAGGRDEAYKVVKEVRERATTGREDFATLSAEFNDDARLKKTGGDLGLGPVQRGAFALEDVEKAVWTLTPDDVSDVVETKGVFYLAKLVSRTAGRTLAFEDPAVQERIRSTLRGKQFAQRRDQVRGNLEKGAVIRVDDAMVQTSVDMAMQRYAQWSGK